MAAPGSGATSTNTVVPAVNTGLPSTWTAGPPLGAGTSANRAAPASAPTETAATTDLMWDAGSTVIVKVSLSDLPFTSRTV